MRHAFLIIAHNNWWQLQQLVVLLDDPQNDIFIHIDKKSMSFNRNDFLNITKYSKVMVFQEYKVYWGGYSMIQAELLLGREAYKIGYDYYHYLSGADLPLKCNSYIHEFFEKNNGYEFVDFDNEKLESDPEISRRARLYHFLQDYRRRYKEKIKNVFFTFLERMLLLFQIVLRVNRVKDNPYVIKYGSNWVSITHRLMSVILEKTEYIYKTFQYTNCADELFIQTIAYNCGFKDYNYIPMRGTANLRLIDWSRGCNGNPYTFKSEDYEMLVRSDELFARKFSESVDKDIINMIINHIIKK